MDGLSSHIRFWWLWVAEILTQWAVDPATQQWLTDPLLPVLYWHHQMDKTPNQVHRKRYRQTWQKAVQAWEANPFHVALSDRELQRWLTWGEWMVRQFHRSSSAVEGRNGCLSQMYHNGRGWTERVTADNLVEIRDLDFAYEDRPILKGISLQIPRGKVVAIMGGSGLRQDHPVAADRRTTQAEPRRGSGRRPVGTRLGR
jgi:hypothetical protein